MYSKMISAIFKLYALNIHCRHPDLIGDITITFNNTKCIVLYKSLSRLRTEVLNPYYHKKVKCQMFYLQNTLKNKINLYIAVKFL